MLKLEQLIRDHTDERMASITLEQGKTLADAKSDVFHRFMVIENASAAGSLMMGETLENLANSLATYSYKQSLGACPGICPFNVLA